MTTDGRDENRWIGYMMATVSQQVTTPVRIQRKRTKGWRMPEGAIYVGRPSRWGNPYSHGRWTSNEQAVVDAFALHLATHPPSPDWLAPLRGHDLACWCPLDQPCHADVLLALANARE